MVWVLCAECGNKFNRQPHVIKRNVLHFCNKICERKFKKENSLLFKYPKMFNKMLKHELEVVHYELINSGSWMGANKYLIDRIKELEK